ncbi:MAG: von Willebrand factor type A domain-containing protein [Sedimentisphaerales bacterium]|nr:von Willebrand factor type A domain-containing protein [Sedimentisphaerales bacterium]
MGGMGGYAGGARGYGMGGMGGYGMSQDDRGSVSNGRSDDYDIRFSGGTSSGITNAGLESNETRLAQARQPVLPTRPPALRPSAEGEPQDGLWDRLGQQGAGRGSRRVAQNEPVPAPESLPSRPAGGPMASTVATPGTGKPAENSIRSAGETVLQYSDEIRVAREQESALRGDSAEVLRKLMERRQEMLQQGVAAPTTPPAAGQQPATSEPARGAVARDAATPSLALQEESRFRERPGGVAPGTTTYEVAGTSVRTQPSGTVADAESLMENRDGDRDGQIVASLGDSGRGWYYQEQDGRERTIYGDSFEVPVGAVTPARPSDSAAKAETGQIGGRDTVARFGAGGRGGRGGTPATSGAESGQIAQLKERLATAFEAAASDRAGLAEDAKGRIVANAPVPQTATPAQEGLNWGTIRETASDEVRKRAELAEGLEESSVKEDSSAIAGTSGPAKVPLAGDTPLVGGLFRGESVGGERTATGVETRTAGPQADGQSRLAEQRQRGAVRAQLELRTEVDKARADSLLNTDEAIVPYSKDMTYPRNWRELVKEPTRQPDKPMDVKLEMNFQDAPLQQVLEYLSEKASLTVVGPQVPLDGRVTMVSRQPVTIDEAVSLINSALKDKDLAAVRMGKSLQVMTTAQAKSHNVPFLVGTSVEDLPPNDEVVTSVLPIRHLDAQVMSQVLTTMAPDYALVEANRDNNVLTVTGSVSNVQRLMKIAQALDAPTDGVADIKIYRLKNAQASNVARLIDEVFYGRGQAAGGATFSNVAVVTAAHDRTNSVVVKGPSQIMTIIDDVIAELDKEPAEATQDTSAKVQQNTQTAQVANEDSGILPPESRFKVVPVNPWVMTERDAQSTFALDVDTASYALCRRYVRSGYLPPVGAVRMEEFVNAFDYAYPQRDRPTFAVYAEGAPSPFAPAGQDLTLLKIAVKARTVGRDQRRAAHLVFVVDTSASMGQADRLPQVQSALNLLVDRLSEGDRVSLVTCANEARLHLEAISVREKDTIRRTIDAIQPAGPTNLLAGLELGYATARRAFVAGQINQVVLCSDGVANVGEIDADAVLAEVADDRKQGITLTCVGVGYGAYNDAFLEALANHGDGRYVFLDAAPESREALVGHLSDTLQTVAKDARIQVEFNPDRVRRYRLIGYENRDIEDQRFRDDTIDAGEVGSGQCSTALYELELIPPRDTSDADLGTVFVRYRDTDTDKIEEIAQPLAGSIVRRRSVEENPRFFLAAGAARFAEWLRQSEHAWDTQLADVQNLLDEVSVVLPLDRDIRDLAALAHQAENLPRAP